MHIKHKTIVGSLKNNNFIHIKNTIAKIVCCTVNISDHKKAPAGAVDNIEKQLVGEVSGKAGQYIQNAGADKINGGKNHRGGEV